MYFEVPEGISECLGHHTAGNRNPLCVFCVYQKIIIINAWHNVSDYVRLGTITPVKWRNVVMFIRWVGGVIVMQTIN